MQDGTKSRLAAYLKVGTISHVDGPVENKRRFDPPHGNAELAQTGLCPTTANNPDVDWVATRATARADHCIGPPPCTREGLGSVRVWRAGKLPAVKPASRIFYERPLDRWASAAGGTPKACGPLTNTL